MQDIEETTEEEMNAPVNPAISDPVWLFRYSGMVDMIRDAAQFFAANNLQDRDAITPLAERYLELRDAIPAALGAEADQTEQWGYRVDPAVVSASGLFAAASMLARWCDLLYQTPTFVTQQKMALAAAHKVSREIDAAQRTDRPTKDAGRGGTYI